MHFELHGLKLSQWLNTRQRTCYKNNWVNATKWFLGGLKETSILGFEAVECGLERVNAIMGGGFWSGLGCENF